MVLMRLLSTAALLACTGIVPAQDYAPSPAHPPDSATLKTITEKGKKLGERIASLRRRDVHDPQLAEAEVYYKAAQWLVRHNEFYQKESPDWTLEALDRGLLRASQLAQGEVPWWEQTGVSVARAYRSRVDGSVQPYAVTFPADYGKDNRKKWRLDVVLHGRDANLTEVKFLHAHNGEKAAPAGQNFVQLDIYGRGNNAYRWAGETDVFEVIDAFITVERLLGRDQLLDKSRVVLRGFSMGGAGSWHIGLHTPDRWCVLGPGAGFTTTRGYVKNLPEKLPPYQEACLRIYDAVEYAENVFNVPVVAYAGDQDPQIQAARNIEARLKPFNFPMTLLVAPGLAHRFPPEWQQKAEELYAPHASKGREEYPKRVRFVTYSLRYNLCNWVDVIALDRHYHKALVDAEQTEDGFNVKSENVRTLHLGVQPGAPGTQTVNIDGQNLEVRPYISADGSTHIYLDRQDGKWLAMFPEKLTTERLRRPQKVRGQQGPIDDAFTQGFVCVRGTGQPWHTATQQYADSNLRRFHAEWSKFLRGELPLKEDAAITPEDLSEKNLILFGDPGSNSLIAQAVGELPLKWTRDSITFARQTYSAADHVPVLIFPSPFNSRRYVVLNSGHTFRAADFQGTNALLYPRLGDYAVLKLAGSNADPLAVEVKTAGLFDDFWRVEAK